MTDFFISYTKADLFQTKIIYDWLVEGGYTCRMQAIDFESGSNFVLEMQKASMECSKTIAILSPDYFNSNFAQTEWAVAFAKDPTGEKRLLIPIRIKECVPKGLLGQIVYIDLVGLQAVDQKRLLLKSLDKVSTTNKTLLFEQGIDNNSKKTKDLDKVSTKGSVQNITGDNNIQVGRDYNIFQKPPKVFIQPSKESIGGDSLLKQRITSLFNKIGEQRESRFGKGAYGVLYKKFKTDFDIKNNKWTIIWDWPKECAPEIIQYLEEKYDNTIGGRKEKASKRNNYIHTRPQLYKKEKELLAHMDLMLDSEEVRDSLELFFGVKSHKDLTHIEHWQWVKVLERRVSEIEQDESI